MQLFLDYVWAVLLNWWGFVPCLLVVVWDLTERAMGRDFHLRRWVKLTILLAGIFVSQFFAYRDLRRELVASQAAVDAGVKSLRQFEEQVKPQPIGNIEEVAVGTLDNDQYRSKKMVTAIVSLRNRGADSVFEGWEIQVTPSGSKQSWSCVETTIPGGFTMIERSGKRDIFRDEDAIERKTFPNAVKRGQAVRGFLNCLTDAPIGHLEASIGLGLEVRYKDVLGIQHEMSMLGKRNADSFVYQPGMRPLRR